MKSILTKYTDFCMFCGKPTTTEHHFLFGHGKRAIADRDGVKGPVCDSCHNMGPLTSRIHDNPMAEKLSKMLGQMAWEKNAVAAGMSEDAARELFLKRYGVSYL